MIRLLVSSSGIGGIERHIATLAQSFARRGLKAEVLVMDSGPDNPWLTQLQSAGIAHRLVSASPAKLRGELKRRRPALLHTHGYKANIVGRIAARLAGVPVLATFHSGERAAFPVSLYFRLDRWSSLLAPRIAVSEPIRAQIPYGAVHIPNYVLPPDDPPKGPLPRRVAFVGRLSHEKAPDLFCRLAREAPGDIEWHLYGDGPMRAELQAAHGDRVTFHGMVTDLEDAWRGMGLMLMPSRFEGLPLAALEALGHGVPLLASRVGALPSVVRPGETGWLFEAEDLDGAKDGLMAWLALDDAEQSAMRERCKAHLAREFSEEKRLSQLFDVYQKAGFDPLGE